jgi:hypothetical protein
MEGLLRAAMDGPPEAVQWPRLEKLLNENPDAVAAYVELMTVHALLRWQAGPTRAAYLSASRSSVIGFLANLPRGGRAAVGRRLTAIAVAVVLLAALVPLTVWLRSAPWRQIVANARSTSESRAAAEGVAPRSPVPAPSLAPVARLARTADCRWAIGFEPPQSLLEPGGGGMAAGQQLRLEAGLAEIVFATGARVILQGPAELKLESALGAVLSRGKITVTAEEAGAKGFTVHSPGMQAIDLGTEFGLEVAPNGLEQVHVFRGEVNVSASPASRRAATDAPGPTVAKLLKAHQGMEVNLNTNGARMVANNGDRFARSLNDAHKNRHVIAYWRFEDHAVGVLVPDTKKGQAPVRGSLDSSLNGNDLYTWSNDTQPRFSADVSSPVVPRTGEANLASLDNSLPPSNKAWSRDLFTMSHWSQPAGKDLQTITPAAWTVEASVKPTKLDKAYQTFVVRDGQKADAKDPRLAPFGFYVTPVAHFAVRYCDLDKRTHAAFAEGVTVQENHWYHVAATSDGANLKLYVDALDGKGYLLWATTGLPVKGSTALGRGEFPPGSDPAASPPGIGYPYIWSVGRGYYNGSIGNWFKGWIDEVRISDVALGPSEFLFAPAKAPTLAALDQQALDQQALGEAALDKRAEKQRH